MGTELRRVIFSNDEIIEAIKSDNEVAKKGLPEGSIVTCRIGGGDGMKLTLEMRDLTTSKLYRVALKTSFMGAALMKWCLDHELPMARSAEKMLEVVGDNLSIAMTLNLHADVLVEGGDGKVQISELERPREAEAVA